MFNIVEDFEKDYHKGYIQIKKEASEQVRIDNGRTMHLSDFLIEALHNYLISKSELEAIEESSDIEFIKHQSAEKEYARWASESLYWITELRGLGLIVETDMKSKLEQQVKLNEQLKEENDKLIKENLRLEELNEELNKVLGNFGVKGNSSTVEGKP